MKSVTFVCTICNKRHVIKNGELPEYCPHCGAHKKLRRARRGEVASRKTVEEYIANFPDMVSAFHDAYREFCIKYVALRQAHQTIAKAAAQGRIPKENVPVFPKLNIVADGARFIEERNEKAKREIRFMAEVISDAE